MLGFNAWCSSYIYIDCSKEECLKRLEESEDRDKVEWEKHINNWWLQYSGGF